LQVQARLHGERAVHLAAIAELIRDRASKQDEMRDSSTHGVNTPDDRVRTAPDDELMFFAEDGTRVFARDMPKYRLFRLEGGANRRYTWPAVDPRNVDVTSLRRQLQQSENADERESHGH
jgi:hypothetical protein